MYLILFGNKNKQTNNISLIVGLHEMLLYLTACGTFDILYDLHRRELWGIIFAASEFISVV
jgi:hypothetical protein